MRQTIIVATTTAIVTAIVTSLGTAAIIGHSPKTPGAAAAATSKSIGVMQLMKDAKNLPEDKYDAH
jgi:hypothetical protein